MPKFQQAVACLSNHNNTRNLKQNGIRNEPQNIQREKNIDSNLVMQHAAVVDIGCGSTISNWNSNSFFRYT